MRDIRGDLQDRASLLEGQISAHEAQFEKLMAQIRAEHEARLKDLRAEFDVVTKLHELEQRRLDNAPQAPTGVPGQPAPEAVPQPSPHSLHQPATPQAHQGVHQPAQQPAPASQPQQPLNDFVVRKLNEVGAMSRDDLRRLSLQEGYFADVESADRGVQVTLFNVVKAGFVRQLPNGNFAPATALDAIRLRRAM
jgi:chromatin segregation and condensation protein Rec8/ScpA/Scc1 (kleisin family)